MAEPVAAALSPRPSHLLYLHGFRSSPASFKARLMVDWLGIHRPELTVWCPQLPPSPAAAWSLIEQGAAAWPAKGMAVVGSSLGGFYATALAEARGCRAMLLNPAVDPARDLAAHVGEQSHFHAPEESFFFQPEFVDELRTLAPVAITRPERYGLLVAQGDEVLDWREMVGRYPGARLRLLEGSDHGLSDFEQHLPFVLDSLGLDT